MAQKREEKYEGLKILLVSTILSLFSLFTIGYSLEIPVRERLADYALAQMAMQSKNICTDNRLVGPQYFPDRNNNNESACFRILPWYAWKNLIAAIFISKVRIVEQVGPVGPVVGRDGPVGGGIIVVGSTGAGPVGGMTN